MQYLLYCVVCFRVQGITKEVFVADVVDVALANCEVLCDNTPIMQRSHERNTKRPMGSHPPLVVTH
jgi:hypothetical protein